MTNNLIVKFRAHIDSHLVAGQDGTENVAHYYPRRYLEEYWTAERIRRLLDSYNPPLTEDEHTISRSFIRIFSILVYAGQPNDIGLFVTKNLDDHHLPFESPSHHFPPNFSRFLKSQWMFCPLEFTRNQIWKRELPIRQIIPVTFEEPLREEHRGHGAARITKARLHPSCTSGIPEDDLLVVFKTHEGVDGEHLYKAESDMYSRLSKSGENNITKFYGSFSYEETQRRMIVLEYAKGGSLLDYFNHNQPPILPQELQMLWTSLLGLLDGLYTLHNLNSGIGSDDRPIAGVHMDIQPANILVFPQSDGSVKFKLVDFGLSVIRQLSRDCTISVNDEGNRMYSAPECYPNHAIQDKVKTNVDTSADIWALGAVFSDVLAWSILGETGREEYRTERKKANTQLSHLKASGFDACFHDGTDRRLRAVDEFHDYLLENRRRTDHLSPRMSRFILDEMLTSRGKRLTASQAKTRAEGVIENSEYPNSTGSSPIQLLSRGDSVQWPGGPGLASNPQHLRQPSHKTSGRPSYGPHGTGEEPGSSFISDPGFNIQTRFPSTSNVNTRGSSVSESEPNLEKQLIEPAPHSTIENSSTQTTDHQNLFEITDLNPAPPTEHISTTKLERNREHGLRRLPNTAHEIITVDRAYALLPSANAQSVVTRNLHKIHRRMQSKVPEIMELRGMQEAQSKVQALGGRDQIMLIDNFSSMEPHMEMVMKMAKVISYVTKVADKNGMDLYFASDTAKPKKCASSTAIGRAFDKPNIVEGTCNMQNCLWNILKPVLVTYMKPTSIYIYTDGIWEPGDDHGVDSVIHECIQHLVKLNKPPSTLMFQFIRFGSDGVGAERLQKLDDECTETHKKKEYDIVDTKDCDEHVPDIIVGSISKWVDKKRAGVV